LKAKTEGTRSLTRKPGSREEYQYNHKTLKDQWQRWLESEGERWKYDNKEPFLTCTLGTKRRAWRKDLSWNETND